MKHILITLWLFLIACNLQGQQYDRYWIMGYKYDSEPLTGFSVMEFKEGEKTSVQSADYVNNTAGMSRYSAITYSNAEGDLQWYSDGQGIYNAAHNFMKKGHTLNIGPLWHELPSKAGYPGVLNQGIPFPGKDSQYLLFHALFHPADKYLYKRIPLYYSLIDMEKEGGLGEVSIINRVMVDDSIGNIALIKHANGKDWWMVLQYMNRSDGEIALIRSDGIYFLKSYNLPIKGGYGIYRMHVSTDGKRIYFSSIDYGSGPSMVILNFDRCEGNLQLWKEIPFTDEIPFTSAFIESPNKKFVYFASDGFKSCMQCDLDADDFFASCRLIAAVDYRLAPFPASFYLLSLAADQRIYIANGSTNTNMPVINRPDLPGEACDTWQDLQLPYVNRISAPQFPNFRLGEMPDGDACATHYPSSGPADVTVLPTQNGEWRMYTQSAHVLPPNTLTLELMESDGITIHCTLPFHRDQFSIPLTGCLPQSGMRWHLRQGFLYLANGIIE